LRNGGEIMFGKQRYLSPWAIWWNARRDGRKNLPPSTTRALGDFEQRIVNAVTVTIAETRARLADVLARPQANLQTSDREFARAQQEDQRLRTKTGRHDLLLAISAAARNVWMTVLFVGEAAINAIAFATLDRSEGETLGIGIALALAFTILSGALGRFARQMDADPHAKRNALALLTALVVGLPGANYFRIVYLRHHNPRLWSDGVWVSVAFLALNVIILTAVAYVKFASTDPEPGFASARKRLWKRMNETHYGQETVTKLKRQAAMDEERARAAGYQAVFQYRQTNRRYRSDPPPAYFDDPKDPNNRPPLGLDALRVIPEARAEIGEERKNDSHETPRPNGSAVTAVNDEHARVQA
jgi:hypothetical protein